MMDMKNTTLNQKNPSPNKLFIAWVIWGIAAAFVLFQFLLQASTSIMIPCLIKAFHINTEQVGFLSSSFFYTYIILQIPSGLLVDKIGAKKLLLGSVLLCALSAGLFGVSHQLSVAETARLIMGLATAPSVVCAMYLASHWLPTEKFALAAGLTEMLGMLGGAIGEAFLAHCVNGIGWRGTMYLCMGVGIVLFLLILFLVKDRPKASNSKSEEHRKTHIKKDLLALIKEPQIWLVGLFAGLVFAIVQAFASLWAVPYLMKLYSIKLDVAAAASSMLFLGTAIFAPIIGIVSNWMGRRKPLMYIGSIIGLFAVLSIIYFPPTRLTWMFSLLFILGASCSTYVVPFAIAREITKPNVRATALGFTNMMTIIIGAPLLQPLVGYILHAESYKNMLGQVEHFTVANYQSAFIGLPIALVFAIIITIFIKETRCHCLYE